MAINISTANNQAAQLRGYADRLQQAKNQLNSYKSSLSANWQGSEVPYILQGIDKAIVQIDAVMRDLRNVANDVSSVASAIKREDDAAAAAARARAAKQQRIAAAQKSYNDACDELSELNKSRDELIKKLKNKPSLLAKYKDKLEEIIKNIEKAEKKCDECKRTLTAARR